MRRFDTAAITYPSYPCYLFVSAGGVGLEGGFVHVNTCIYTATSAWHTTAGVNLSSPPPLPASGQIVTKSALLFRTP